ncbi:redoxin family protein [Streptomyces sp. AV19]|uniref:MerR family transcriptional regulator n=1 Tax=Streptomyces sp. AV19 TaxID=2793068 RepID=UPI0018FEADEC|nr:MerR family transcriptional regulator [Streptomyces sp. AV19]MBH1938312.1 redoxin family protein [Streptomyces sp. AV19]MDG4534953.1 redoxin family protein [Streptomyces sp. AV19]
MRIGDAARRAGATVKAVRYYEALGLVTPVRLGNGYRDYGEHDVRVIREIRTLNRLGIPVELTRPFLDCIESGRPHADDCPASLAGYQDAIDDLTRRIGELSARRAALVRQLHEAAHRNSTVPPGEPMHDFTSLPAGLPVPEDDGACDHLPGLAVPRLELAATDGRTVRLDAPGPGRTVVYLYPLTGRPDRDLPEGWDAIPGARGCTPESCGFRDHHEELVEAGAGRVFGLSGQDTTYQREVVDRLRLPFAILSDPGLRLADELKLPTFEAGGQRLFKRLTLVLRDGLVEHVFYPVFPPNEHAGQVLEWLRAHPA